MKTVLVACTSKESAERGLRVAVDLSVACGARLSLAFARDAAGRSRPPGDLGAMQLLSDVLFSAPHSNGSGAPWLADYEAVVGECWHARDWNALVAEVRERRPDLIVTCDHELARKLVAETDAAVWQVRTRRGDRQWFSARRIRCEVRGSRAAEWARKFADGLGAELETTGAADLLVLDRGSRAPLVSFVAPLPVVVV